MSRFVYQPEHIVFFKKNVAGMSVKELTAAFNTKFKLNKSVNNIKGALTNHKITSGRKRGLPKGSYQLFNKKQVAWLRINYKTLTRAELTSAFNKKFHSAFKESQIITFLKNHKIRSGRNGQFQKGMKVWNEGTKGMMKANKTSFKKGHKSMNIRPLGSERVNVDGYIEIKTGEPNKWEAKHRVVWQQHNPDSPLKASDVIRFIDNDKRNITPENLTLFTRSEHMRATQLGYSDALPEHKTTIKLLSQIASKADQRATNLNDK